MQNSMLMQKLQRQRDFGSIKLRSFLAADLQLGQAVLEVPSTHILQYKKEMVL